MALNSLSELPLVGSLSGAKRRCPQSPKDAGVRSAAGHSRMESGHLKMVKRPIRGVLRASTDLRAFRVSWMEYLVHHERSRVLRSWIVTSSSLTYLVIF